MKKTWSSLFVLTLLWGLLALLPGAALADQVWSSVNVPVPQAGETITLAPGVKGVLTLSVNNVTLSGRTAGVGSNVRVIVEPNVEEVTFDNLTFHSTADGDAVTFSMKGGCVLSFKGTNSIAQIHRTDTYHGLSAEGEGAVLRITGTADTDTLACKGSDSYAESNIGHAGNGIHMMNAGLDITGGAVTATGGNGGAYGGRGIALENGSVLILSGTAVVAAVGGEGSASSSGGDGIRGESVTLGGNARLKAKGGSCARAAGTGILISGGLTLFNTAEAEAVSGDSSGIVGDGISAGWIDVRDDARLIAAGGNGGSSASHGIHVGSDGMFSLSGRAYVAATGGDGGPIGGDGICCTSSLILADQAVLRGTGGNGKESSFGRGVRTDALILRDASTVDASGGQSAEALSATYNRVTLEPSADAAPTVILQNGALSKNDPIYRFIGIDPDSWPSFSVYPPDYDEVHYLDDEEELALRLGKTRHTVTLSGEDAPVAP